MKQQNVDEFLVGFGFIIVLVALAGTGLFVVIKSIYGLVF